MRSGEPAAEAALERMRTSSSERLRERAGKAGTARERAECALRDQPSHSRYPRQLATGRLRIDRPKVAAEERLDG